jgi:hypothetical protein
MAVTGTEAQIYDALAAYLTGLTFTPAVKIAMPGVDFTPERGKPYLVATYMPNTADVFGGENDSDVDYQGLLQISVFWPARAGIVKPLQVAAQIVAAFKPGTKIDANGLRIRIDRQPTVAPSLTESDLVQIAVTVRWRVLVPATA